METIEYARLNTVAIAISCVSRSVVAMPGICCIVNTVAIAHHVAGFGVVSFAPHYFLQLHSASTICWISRCLGPWVLLEMIEFCLLRVTELQSKATDRLQASSRHQQVHSTTRMPGLCCFIRVVHGASSKRLAPPRNKKDTGCMGFLWVTGFSFLHCVASPFHSFVTIAPAPITHES